MQKAFAQPSRGCYGIRTWNDAAHPARPPCAKEAVRAGYESWLLFRRIDEWSCEWITLSRDNPRMLLPPWLLSFIISVGLPKSLRTTNVAATRWFKQQGVAVQRSETFTWPIGTTLLPGGTIAKAQARGARAHMPVQ